MKKEFGLLILATFLLTGCDRKEINGIQHNSEIFPTFYAYFDDNADTNSTNTKTYVDEKMVLRWTKEDRLSIFAGNSFNHEYKYDGETGACNGSFSAVATPEFVAGERLDPETNYAIYPYNASNRVDTDSDRKIHVVLPFVQQYAECSFGLGANTMVAVTENSNDMLLQFKNICGYVVFKLFGKGVVKAVYLEGNNGEKISGEAFIVAEYGMPPAVWMENDAATSITLDCGTGVTLGTTAETATEFWFCVPPVTFSQGFTVTAITADGWQMTKSTSSSKEVVRNTRHALAAVEAEFDTYIGTIPPDNEIWYTTSDGKPISLLNTHNFYTGLQFNANVISNEYRSGKGIIRFDAPVTIIPSLAIRDQQNLVSLLLPKSIKKIEPSAISCDNLESVVINSKSLDVTGNNPFSVCPNLRNIEGPLASVDGKCLIINDTLYGFAPYGITEYTIPDGVKTIKSGFYLLCPNKIIIPEGVETIEDYAFYTASLEYVCLPSSLKYIGYSAFSNNKNIKAFYGNSSFVSSDGMCLIYNNCIISFASGAGLTEYTIPEGVDCIGRGAFYYATSLKKLNLPDSFLGFPCVYWICKEDTINGNSWEGLVNTHLEGTTNIEMITGKYVLDDNRSMVVDGRLVMYAGAGQEKYVTPKGVSIVGNEVLGNNNSIKEYVFSDEIVGLDGYGYLFCYNQNLETVTISANMEYMGYDPFDNVTSVPNLKNVYCRAVFPPTVHFASNAKYRRDIKIYVPEQSVELYKRDWYPYKDYIQGYKYEDLPDMDYYVSTDYSADGTVHTVQTATVGNAVNVVLMGDAFSDRQITDGTYNKVMQKAVNALFSEEPYKSYKDYFNVYTVDAVSMTEGYEHEGQVFSTGHGDGTYVYGNDNKVFEYAQKALTAEQMDDALIIVMMNEDAYAGTCFMYYPNSGDYGRGPSIAYFPASSDTDTFNGLVSHEAGGHGFAKLADEYAYEYMGTISDQAIGDTRQMEPYGWWKNVDFTSDPTQVKWSKFLSDERYANEGLGCFEGGLTYWSGVWRPTDYSIMRYNTGGFNAPSREAIWYRIHKLAYGEDWEYNYEDFVAYDAINRTPAAQAESRAKVKAAAAARKGKPFQPLHEPVVVKRSWKEAVNNPGKDGR